MSEEAVKLTPQQELKEKLRQIRKSYVHAKKLIAEVEKSHTAFTRIKDALANKDNGVEANFKWLKEQRKQITDILADANKKLNELVQVATSIQDAVNDITTKHSSFTDLAKQVFDENEGLDAVLKATKKLKANTDKLAEKVEKNATDSSKRLETINDTAKKVADAYATFLEKKKLVDDEENGLTAQLRRATDDANSTQDAKIKAEAALVSVTKFQEKSNELVVDIGDSKKTVEDYQKESEKLTAGIRNTLNQVTEFSLSQALQTRTNKLSSQMRWWAIAQTLSIVGLTVAVAVIFYILFYHSSSSTDVAVSRIQSGPDLVSVVSKFLFTTPLIFAVYFTTSNFRHVRDLRDKYAWKETVAKNFQNYVLLIKDEFKDSEGDKHYEEERFKFSMETIRSIYAEPNPIPKKRKYNFSLYNRIFQAKLEEEDLIELKRAVTESVKEEIADGPVSIPVETSSRIKENELKDKPIQTVTLRKSVEKTIADPDPA